MTGYVLASLIFLGGIITALVGELLNEEIRGWLDYLPRLILRLAARQLDPAGKITIYEDEWLPELACILRGAEARPISRVIIGVKFSIGLLVTARRIARHLHRAPAESARSRLVFADATSLVGRLEILRVQAVEARLRVIAEYRVGLAALMETTKRQLDTAMASACNQASSEDAQTQSSRHVDSLRVELEDLRRQDDSMRREERSCIIRIHPSQCSLEARVRLTRARPGWCCERQAPPGQSPRRPGWSPAGKRRARQRPGMRRLASWRAAPAVPGAEVTATAAPRPATTLKWVAP